MELTSSSSFHHSLRQLCDESKARSAIVLKSDGHLVDASGEIHNLDLTSIAALASGVLVAAFAIGGVIGAGECKGVSLEGESNHFYVTKLGNEEILIVIYGAQTNEGTVRWRVRQYRKELERMLGKVSAAEETRKREPAFEDLITKPKPKNLFEALSEAEVDDALGFD